MKIRQIALYAIFLLTIPQGCGLISHFKISKALENESVRPYTFKQEIPFQFESGHIFIEVLINKETYNFVFDTGASTTLDEDLAKSVFYSKIGKQKHIDVLGNKNKLEVVILDSLSIEGIRFSSVVATIRDLDALNKNSCVHFDGIIGANVMNKAVWQIDYDKQIIILTDDRHWLNQPEAALSFDFTATGKKCPKVSLSLNGNYLGEVTIDTGSSGGIDLLAKDLSSVDEKSKFIIKHGATYGLFGELMETSKTTIASNVSLDDNYEIKNVPVTFNESLSLPLIGNSFLSNYMVTIDWKYQEITLSPNSNYSSKWSKTYGFATRLMDNKILIGSLIENSSAHIAGLQINDQIIGINSMKVETITKFKYCELAQYFTRDNGDQLIITIKRNNDLLKFTLVKQDLFKLLLD